ncbi:hypothetical protein ACFX13_006402 [Malus domestica]
MVIVGNSKQRAKSTEGIADHDEHLGNVVEKTEGLRFWGRTIACDGEINGERRFDICTMTSGSQIEVEWLEGHDGTTVQVAARLRRHYWGWSC